MLVDEPNLENLVYCVCRVPVLIEVAVFFSPEHADAVPYSVTSCPCTQHRTPQGLLKPTAPGSRHLDKKSMEDN